MIRLILIAAAAALFLVPVAAAHPPAAHGTVTIHARLCDRTISIRRDLVSTNLVSLTGKLGNRHLRYWNESPSTSYLYGVNTFVRVGLSGHALSFRAVRLVPVCAPLRLSYSW